MSWLVTSIVATILAIFVIVGIVAWLVGMDVQGDLDTVDD